MTPARTVVGGVTLALGVMGVVAPKAAMKLVGLRPAAPHGTPEVRATYGGLFVGLALAAFTLDSEDAWRTVGFAWLGAGVARAATLPIDEVLTRENLGGIVGETALGLAALTRPRPAPLPVR